MSSKHEIVILGAHHGGLGIAHYLLKHVIPALSKTPSSTTYHITVVSPVTHFWWNISAPREAAAAGLIPVDKAYVPLASAFKSYNKDLYTIVYGKASAIDPDTKTVTIDLNSNGTESVTYSSLVIATGSSSNSALWTINESHEKTIAAMNELHASLQKAKTILIAGGGPVGVETAGEIATHNKSAQKTLLSGSSKLLTSLLPANSRNAESRLKALGVSVEHNLRVTTSTKTPQGSTTLELSDGTTRTVDVYIDATGMKPNSSFVPKAWLDERSRVKTDPKTLRATFPNGAGIYAIGDVASYSNGTAMAVKFSIPSLGSSIANDLAAAAKKSSPVKQQSYKEMKDTSLVPTGPKAGVGQAFGWKLPSMMVAMAKGKTFLLENMVGTVDGSSISK